MKVALSYGLDVLVVDVQSYKDEDWQYWLDIFGGDLDTGVSRGYYDQCYDMAMAEYGDRDAMNVVADEYGMTTTAFGEPYFWQNAYAQPAPPNVMVGHYDSLEDALRHKERYRVRA